MRPILLLPVILLFCTSALAQSDSSSVRVAIRMLDATNNRPIFNAQCISYISQHHFVSDEDGLIIYNFASGDSLRVFSMGYEAQTLLVKEFSSLDTIVDVVLERHSYMIQGVDVGGTDMHLHLPEDITLGKNEDLAPVSLRNDGFTSKPTVMQGLKSPIGFLYYHTSKSEKKKRNMRAELAKHEEQQIVNSFYNPNIIKEVSGYENETLNSFIIYCNVNLKITSQTNPLVVKQLISEAKREFEKRD